MEASCQFHAPATLPAVEKPPLPVLYEAGWTLVSLWMLWRKENLQPLPGIEPRLRGRTARRQVAIPTELSWLSPKEDIDTKMR
jgi:hypothetical protein